MTEGRLKRQIEEYTNTSPLPMHMPGHKRNPAFGNDIFAYDITEIEGFDNLHKPRGIFLDAENKLAGIYNAKKSYLSVNGATGGLLAVIMAAARPGGTIAVHSACHISVLHAVELSGCKITYLKPEIRESVPFYCEVTADTVKQAIEDHPDICCVVITSPTYEGIVSNTEEIFAVTDPYGIPLIVDSAHGAHLGLTDRFLPAPVCDADIVSLHKTLPAPTQTAAMNIFTDKIDLTTVEHYIDVFESSSPSYVLSDGAIACIDAVRSDKIPFDEWADLLDSLIYEPLTDLKHIKLCDLPSKDRTRIVLICNGVSLARHLRKNFNIECEAAYKTHLIAMTGAGDTAGSLERFRDAVLASDLPGFALDEKTSSLLPLPDKVMSSGISEALSGSRIKLPVEQCIGRICAEYVFCYPPGVPLLIPGELISREVMDYIRSTVGQDSSVTLSGRRDWDGTLCCLDDLPSSRV